MTDLSHARRTIEMCACILAMPPIGTRCREPDERLLAILTKDGPLTADEQAYVDMREAADA